MRRFITWIVGLPVAVAATVVAVANRQTVGLELWPFPVVVETPVFLVLLLSLATGLVVGFGLAWLSQARWRRQARQSRRQVESLEREVEVLRRRTAQAAVPANAPVALPPHETARPA